MKRFRTLLVALTATTLMFAQGTLHPAEITYELNGGWTNDSGWQNKQDMYAALNALWNTYANVPADYEYYIWTPLDSCADNTSMGIPSACYGYASKGIPAMDASFFADVAVKKEFQWLVDFMQYVCTLQKVEADLLGEGYWCSAFLRSNLQAFFLSTQREAYPYTANYESYGNTDAFQSYWKHGFDNPDKVDAPYTLQNPYREDTIDGNIVKYTFMGWYDNPDFKGGKITTINENTTGTLYAKWGEYIPTVSEVLSMTNGSMTALGATTTYFDDTEAYLQDYTGGIRVIFPEGTALAGGIRFTVNGVKSVVNNAPTLVVTKVVDYEATEEVVPIVVDRIMDLYDYTGMLVRLEGKRIAGYTEEGDPCFRDDYDTIVSYRVPVDKSVFYVQSMCDVVGVVERTAPYITGAHQLSRIRLRAFVEDVTLSMPAGRDTYQYESMVIDGHTYDLSNDWIYSVVLDNYNTNKPNDIASGSRGMVLHDGFLYFPNRDGNQPSYINFKKVDAETGNILDAIPAADYLFRTRGIAGGNFVFGPANDLKTDNAGHVLAANLVASAKGEYQVWVMDDIDNGAGYLLICDTTLNNDFANTVIRFDAFGVYGDVTDNAIVMAASSSTEDVYYWNIREGKWDGKHYRIKTTGGHNFGSAPQIFPTDNYLFYVDGFNDYPVLFNIQGKDIRWFDMEDETCRSLVTNRNGKIRATGHNGLVEFKLGGEYFLLMAGNNTLGNPASTFVLYRFADKKRVFADMTPMWEFPYDGMGDTSNDMRVAVPCVQVVDDHTARIAVYTNNNGYGVYTLSVAASGPTDSQSIADESNDDTRNVRKIFRNGQVLVQRNGKTYTLTGMEVE